MEQRTRFFTLIELVVLILCVAFFVGSAMILLGITGCSAPYRQTAYLAQCASNCKQFAQSNHLYGTVFNGFVTPIAWDDGVNIWPAILWNQQSNVMMPYKKPVDDAGWGRAVKSSHLFDCPADKDTKSLSDSDGEMPKLSYAINRSAVRNMKSSSNAASIPSGPVLKTTKFKIPSQMIYVADTAWNKGASASDVPGRLYSTRQHSLGFKPGSIVSHVDQGRLGSEFLGGSDETKPWHSDKTWNYAFIDGHAANLRPEQTINTRESGVEKNEPSGYWTWNQRVWGADD